MLTRRPPCSPRCLCKLGVFAVTQLSRNEVCGRSRANRPIQPAQQPVFYGPLLMTETSTNQADTQSLRLLR